MARGIKMSMKHMITSNVSTLEESYDPDTDTMYVSFGTGEPSYAEEVDDVLLIERGMFSDLPTGFRILNFKEHKAVITVKKMRNKLGKIRLNDEKKVMRSFQEREKALERGIGKTLQAVA